jgi:hypothetical protein
LLALEHVVGHVDSGVLVVLWVNVIMHVLHLVRLNMDHLTRVNLSLEEVVELLPSQQMVRSESSGNVGCIEVLELSKPVIIHECVADIPQDQSIRVLVLDLDLNGIRRVVVVVQAAKYLSFISEERCLRLLVLLPKN